jgi:hypothetical protein
VNNELEGVGIDAVVICFRVPYQHLPGETKKNHGKNLVHVADLVVEKRISPPPSRIRGGRGLTAQR